MSEFRQYRRSQIAELRPYKFLEFEVLSDRVSISAADKKNGSPKMGDMIARNPKFHDDQWLVAARYFEDNFEPCAPQPAPIDMILYCPNCGKQHLDEPENQVDKSPECVWQNPPHRSHLCASCGCIWRPADVATNGVSVIQTDGNSDSWQQEIQQDAQPAMRLCSDCPPVDYPTDKTRCAPCPRRAQPAAVPEVVVEREPKIKGISWFSDNKNMLLVEFDREPSAAEIDLIQSTLYAVASPAVVSGEAVDKS